MSVHPAVARRLFYRQRRWVIPGAILLAGQAGFVDLAAVGLAGLPVSHMSGSVARAAGDAAAGNLGDLGRIATIVASFLLGAIVSGMVIGGSRVLPGRRYGVALLLESAALTGAAWLLAHGLPGLGAPLAALACGIQNGMANGFYGVVLRTTHLTGILTDLGVSLGHRLRGGDVAWWRVGLLSGVLAGFVAGGVTGALAASRLGPDALVVPATASLVGGVVYSWWLWRQHPRRTTRSQTRSERRAQRSATPHRESAAAWPTGVRP